MSRYGRPSGRTPLERAASRVVLEARNAAEASIDEATVRACTKVLRDVAGLERMLECLGHGALARRAAKTLMRMER